MHEYRYKDRVQFAETDAAGIVHFSNYFRYLERAEHAMWRAAGVSIAPAGSEIGWPRVAASFEYEKPLKFEDEFEVHLCISAKSKKTLSYMATIRKSGDVVAHGRLTIACVRKRPGEPMTAIDLPLEIDRIFQVAPESKPHPKP